MPCIPFLAPAPTICFHTLSDRPHITPRPVNINYIHPHSHITLNINPQESLKIGQHSSVKPDKEIILTFDQQIVGWCLRMNHIPLTQFIMNRSWMALFHVVKRFCNYGAKRLTLLILHVGGFEMTNSLASKLSFNMQPYICFIGLGGGCCAHIEGKSTFVCCPPAGWLPSKGNKHLEAKFKFCSCCSCILCLPRYVGGWISQLAA